MTGEESSKPFFLNGFLLKVFAFLFMTIDHLGVFLAMRHMNIELAEAFRHMGRIAFPLFVFLLCEGMRLSHRKERYLFRLGLMYAIITIPETVLVYVPSLASNFGVSPSTLDPHPFADVFFLGLLLYFLAKKGWKKAFALLPLAYFLASFYLEYYDFYNPYFPYYLRSGYDIYGLLLALLIFGANLLLDHREAKNGPTPRWLRNVISSAMIGATVGLTLLLGLLVQQGMYSRMVWQSYSCLAIPFVLFYSGKRGYDSKWWRVFSYSYFLLHMAVLYLIFAFI